MLWPGASDAAPTAIVLALVEPEGMASLADTLLSVTLPVFVMVPLKVISPPSPTASVHCFVADSAGDCGIGTFFVSVLQAFGVPQALAELVTLPLSMSA